MKNKEKISMAVECEECKHRFKITPDDEAGSVQFKREFFVNEQSIFLTYYDCPSCGRRHFVQIDDKVSLEKLNETKKLFVKLSIMKRKGREIPIKQSAKFKKARQHLSDYRMNLMKQYTGKLIHDNETDSDFVLRFSV
jgi:DNA-directed RNA polymerase subunit RPC12/RpoP